MLHRRTLLAASLGPLLASAGASSETGSIIVGNAPEQFAARIAAEFAVYKRVVAAQKLKLD